MKSSQELWQSYHAAVKAGKIDLANQILRSLHKFKSKPLPKGGCVKCQRRFF